MRVIDPKLNERPNQLGANLAEQGEISETTDRKNGGTRDNLKAT